MRFSASTGLLRAEPATDLCALVIAGHSESALTGLLPAEEGRPRPAGLVLLQRQAIRLLDLIALQLHDQLAAAVRAGQVTPEQQLVNVQCVDRAIRALRADGPLDPTDPLSVLVQFFQTLFDGPSRRFALSSDRVYPSAAASRLRPAPRSCRPAAPTTPGALRHGRIPRRGPAPSVRHGPGSC